MADINKLSVGQALDKLRGTDPKKTKFTQIDEKMAALDQETLQLRSARRRIERDQKGGGSDRKD